MFRMVLMLFHFFLELIFDSKEEYDFRSRRFNPRKVVVYILICGSFVTNLILVDRIYKLALENTHLRTELNSIKQKITSLSPSDSAKTTSNPPPTKKGSG